MKEMALPPCHMFAQFYVTTPSTPSEKALLSCQLYQRSCDLGLGIPFNIASYALLTHLLAHVTGTTAHEFIHVMGDAHIYNDHVEALRTQIERSPRSFPTIHVDRTWEGGSVDECVKKLDDMEWENIKIEGYDPHGKIVMKMSV